MEPIAIAVGVLINLSTLFLGIINDKSLQKLSDKEKSALENLQKRIKQIRESRDFEQDIQNILPKALQKIVVSDDVKGILANDTELAFHIQNWAFSDPLKQEEHLSKTSNRIKALIFPEASKDDENIQNFTTNLFDYIHKEILSDPVIFRLRSEIAHKKILLNLEELEKYFTGLTKDHKDLKDDHREMIRLLKQERKDEDIVIMLPKNPFYLPFNPNPQFSDPFHYLEKLHEELDNNPILAVQSRYVVAAVGMGGIGKTQLAIEYAHSFKSHYPGGVFWINAGDDVDMVTEFLRVAPHMGIMAKQDASEFLVISHIEEYLNSCGKNALVIFDNVQNLRRLGEPLENERVKTSLVPETLKCRTLFTTRIDCRDAYPGIRMETLPEETAVRLLCHRAVCKIRKTTWKNADLITIDEIQSVFSGEETWEVGDLARMFGYLPLAITVASAILSERIILREFHKHEFSPITEMKENLKKKGIFKYLDEHALSPEELATKHDPIIHETFRESWEMLREKKRDIDAKSLFKAICFFPEAVPLKIDLLGMASGISEEDTILAVQRLLNLSLVLDISDDILRIHPLAREFSGKLLTNEEKNRLFKNARGNFVRGFTDPSYLERRARQNEQGFEDLAYDFSFVLDLFNKYFPESIETKQFYSLWRAFCLECHNLREALKGGKYESLPAFFFQQWRNRLFEEGLLELCSQKDFLPSISSGIWLKQLSQVKTTDPAIIRIFKGHKYSVNSVTFSPDGASLASSSSDKTVILWDFKSGKLIRIFKGHEDVVLSVAFSPDGKYLASVTYDNTIILWDIKSGKQFRIFKGHKDWVRSIVFSLDGTSMYSASLDKIVIMWDVKSGKKIRTLKGHEDEVRSVAFSPDGIFLASASFDKTFILWDVKTGKYVRTFKGHKDLVRNVYFSPNSELVGSVSKDKTVILWEIKSGKSLAVYPLFDIPLGIWFSPYGKKLLIADNGGAFYKPAIHHLAIMTTGQESRGSGY